MENKEPAQKQSLRKILIQLLINAFLLISFLLLNTIRSTGKSLHEILGFAIGVFILIHLILHWKIALGYFKRISTKHEFLPILRLMVDIVLCASLFAIIVTGLMLSHSPLPSLGIQLGRAGGEIETYRKLITHYTIYILALRILLQWKWYPTVIKRLIVNPLAALCGKQRSNEIA